MMKRLLGTFVLGLAALLPVVLLVYAAGRLLMGIERLAQLALLIWLPASLRFPGLGLIVAIAVIILAGLVARSWIGPPIGRFIETRIGRIPLIGAIYLSLRDMTRRFSARRSLGYKAVVFIPGADGSGRLGLVAEFSPLAGALGDRQLIPVYVPASFQPGGHVELVPRAHLEVIDMSIDHALSLILSGGLARGDAGERLTDVPNALDEPASSL